MHQLRILPNLSFATRTPKFVEFNYILARVNNVEKRDGDEPQMKQIYFTTKI